MSDNDGYQGVQKPNSASSEYNAMSFLVQQIINGRNIATLVKIMGVTSAGGLALAGTVDVLPLVNQLDGNGNAVAHGTVNDIPYYRMQGGANAVIMDPQVGDIGICVFADRDISSVRANKAAANPGSFRRSDMADGLYLGGVLNGVPNQYMMFTEDGIKLFSPTKINLEAPTIEMQAEEVTIDGSTSVTMTTPIFTVNGDVAIVGNTTMDGNLDATGTITAPNVVGTANVTFGGKSGVGHKHGGVATGGGQTGVPV
jgi:hypothetical protein